MAVVAAEFLKPLPWRNDAVARMRAMTNLMAPSPSRCKLAQIATGISGRRPWKKRLPSLLEM